MQLNTVKAIVTGGASGLGREVAASFIEAGARVVLLDVNDQQGQASAQTMGERAKYLNCDVSSEESVQAAVATAQQNMEGLNVAMNCAGILGAGRVLGKQGPMPLERFSRTIAVNLIGSFNVAKAAAAVMADNPPGEDGERGVIINTASVAAYEGQIGQAAYSASKGGLVGMTLPMARELTRFGIRVMSIAPGIFHTPMVDQMPEPIQQALGASIPYPRRLGKPSEFADLVQHILTNRYLNGSTIRLDGAVRLQPK